MSLSLSSITPKKVLSVKTLKLLLVLVVVAFIVRYVYKNYLESFVPYNQLVYSHNGTAQDAHWEDSLAQEGITGPPVTDLSADGSTASPQDISQQDISLALSTPTPIYGESFTPMPSEEKPDDYMKYHESKPPQIVGIETLPEYTAAPLWGTQAPTQRAGWTPAP